MSVNMRQNQSRDYTNFALISLVIAVLAMSILAYFSFHSGSAENSDNLTKAAREIDRVISTSFDHANQINVHFGMQIAQGDPRNLQQILNVLKDAELIKQHATNLFSWSSLDWVNDKNLQVVNSRIGIRKNPPDMSQRRYIKTAPQNPWKLQISFPALGNPSNAWIIPAATPVVDKNGKYLGLISLGFDIARLEQEIKKQIDDDVNYLVISAEGELMLKSSSVILPRDTNFFVKNQNLLNGQNGFLTQKITINEIEFSNIIQNSTYPFTVITGYDRDFLNHKFVTTVLPRIIELICVAIFFLMILYLLKTRLTLLEKERSLRQSLERVNKAKDRILSSIAHDIKNQIYGINGLSRMILSSKNREDVFQNEDLQTVETIIEQSEDMMEFVKDLLDENQIEAGEFNLGKMKECQIRRLVEEAVLISSSFAASCNVDITVKIAEKIPPLFCSERRIKQVLINLISNAIKYSAAESSVELEAQYIESEKQIKITITDHGIGMSLSEVEMVLSGNGANIVKDVGKIDSHGIGMKIVMHLVALHGGKIFIESEKNNGTKVTLIFCADRDHSLKNQEIFVNADSSKKLILVVDDNPTNIKITTKILTDLGYRVRSAENGQDALQILDEEEFDLILMDGEMPIMNGYEATIQIREGAVFKRFKKYKTIPIVALMSSSDEVTIKRALDCGMNFHLEKSTSKTKLLAVISEVLKD